MDKCTAQLILAMLEETHTTIAINHHAALQEGEALGTQFPELNPILLPVMVAQDAEVRRTLAELETRIAAAKLAIEIFEIFEE